MQRTIAVIFGLSFFFAGACGGSDESPSAGQSREKSSPSASPTPREKPSPSESPAFREIDAGVGGRTLAGHCSGRPHPGSPTVILESGVGAGQDHLTTIEQQLSGEWQVCAYDRAGVGLSDPPPTNRRSLADLVNDLEGFLNAAALKPPYFMIGQSLGANVVFSYAQSHPKDVAGFVAMNPVPPYSAWIPAARKVETKQEMRDYELSFYGGENDEEVQLRDTSKMLTQPLPSSMLYAVMFADDCGGDTEFCGRVLEPLAATTKKLAAVGQGGTFVWFKNAGHEIFASDLFGVMDVINDVRGQLR